MSLALAAACPAIYAPAQDRAIGADGAAVRDSIEQAVAPPGPPNRTAEMLVRVDVAIRKGTEVEGVLVNAEAVSRMFDVLGAVPFDVPLPEIVVESDDAIGLDWQTGSRRVLSLTIDSSPYIGFAALIGHESNHGRAPFAGNLPKTIADLLRRIYPLESGTV